MSIKKDSVNLTDAMLAIYDMAHDNNVSIDVQFNHIGCREVNIVVSSKEDYASDRVHYEIHLLPEDLSEGNRNALLAQIADCISFVLENKSEHPRRIYITTSGAMSGAKSFLDSKEWSDSNTDFINPSNVIHKI